mmetsp:Transcript_13667/g.19917  ORF Transcript_13667/g.19917 Transcript_13667/m.19917 type:complete len:126 (+) Transcript_13667:691-1068(+)
MCLFSRIRPPATSEVSCPGFSACTPFLIGSTAGGFKRDILLGTLDTDAQFTNSLASDSRRETLLRNIIRDTSVVVLFHQRPLCWLFDRGGSVFPMATLKREEAWNCQIAVTMGRLSVKMELTVDW